MWVDTHTHLQFAAFDTDRHDVIRRAIEAGVERMVVIGTNLADSRAAVELAAEHPEHLRATVGIHPGEAGHFDDTLAAELGELAADPAVVAIGEVGLDYYRDRCPREAQIEAFLAQQRLALELDLPLVIHCREAHDDVYDALRRGGGFGTKVVMHCFTTHPAAVSRFVAAGCWLGTDGPLSYPKAAEARDIVAAVPADRLLIETDCPYLAPQSRRGKRCEPRDVVEVGETVATVLGLSRDEAAARTADNAARFFGWSYAT